MAASRRDGVILQSQRSATPIDRSFGQGGSLDGVVYLASTQLPGMPQDRPAFNVLSNGQKKGETLRASDFYAPLQWGGTLPHHFRIPAVDSLSKSLLFTLQ